MEFTSPYSGGEWVNADEGSAVSIINTGDARLELTGTGTDSGKSFQTSDTTDNGTPHGFKFRVLKGTVLIQIGESGVDSASIFEGSFNTGDHHIEFTPTTDFTITVSNDKIAVAYVDQVQLIPSSAESQTTIFLETALGTELLSTGDLDKLRSLRWAPVANDIYFASKFFLPFVVRRLGERSYSLEKFETFFGPYEDINISSITMNPTAPIDGDMEIVASKQYFDQAASSIFGFEEGSLFKMAITGQTQTATGSDNSVETLGIFVFGVGDARKFTVDIVTTGVYTEVRLEKSFDEITWQTTKTYTSGADVNEVFDDGLDGAETFYRLQVEDIGAATNIILSLSYDFGTLEAQGRIFSRTNSTTVDVEWYVPLNVDQTVRDWSVGSWGGKLNYPSAVAFYEGRLWFAGGNKVWGSETDFYESFDRTIEGGSASIQRTIGFGSAENILWLAPSARLVAGLVTGEIDIRSNNFSDVLTDSNVNLKAGSDMGAADVAPISLDQEIIFVQKGGNKLIGIDFTSSTEKHDIEDFNMLNPAAKGEPKIVRMAFSRNPETRIYCVMDDGTMRVVLRQKEEDVLAWSRLSIRRNDGSDVLENIVDIAIVPGTTEDRIYLVSDLAPGIGKILKVAETTAAVGGVSSRHFDSFVEFTSPGTTITLPSSTFLTGQSVAVWVDGVDAGDFTVDLINQINGVTSGTDVVVGYRYAATYKSNKLGDYTSASVLTANKRIYNTGLIIKDLVQGVLTVGPDTASLSAMPLVEDGNPAVDDDDYDHIPFEFDGETETDPRIHLRATGPCNILALSYEVKDTDRKTQKQG